MRKFTFLFFLIFSVGICAQTELVFIFFNDKPNKAAFYANPLSELTQKSLDRRTALGIPLNDQDVPVEPLFIQSIENLGFTVTDISKWLNGVAVQANAAQISIIQNLPMVQSVESFAKISGPGTKMAPQHQNKFGNFQKSALASFNYGNGSAQIDQINLRNLHVAGFTGSGITIAIIDTGYPAVDTANAYQRLWTNNQIKGGYNFVSKNTDIYNSALNPHGSVVLGAIGGYIDHVFVGSAPDADFYLYISENTAVEIPEEELYWIMAAEEADRKGADIINTSLGYNTFDDPKYSYTYSDMNGTASFIARGAQIAAEKGIIVMVAAGNSGASPWHYITTPADNQMVFTVGAVDDAGNSSTFSSYGPNAAGIIKPDAAARGTAAASVSVNGPISSNGTSLATPIAAGGVACLLQAVNPATPRALIRSRLRETASLFPAHTDQMGYGILNFGGILQTFLSTHDVENPAVKVYPNPVVDYIYVEHTIKMRTAEIYDHLGRMVRKLSPVQNKIYVDDLVSGIYYLKVQSEGSSFAEKFIKK